MSGSGGHREKKRVSTLILKWIRNSNLPHSCLGRVVPKLNTHNMESLSVYAGGGKKE